MDIINKTLDYNQVRCLVRRFGRKNGYCACEPLILTYSSNNLDDCGYCGFYNCHSCKASKINDLISFLEGWA